MGCTTNRLILRPFMQQDFELLYSLHSNPEVAQTTIDGVQDEATVQKHLTNFIEHQEKFGYSQWAVFEVKSGEFVGRAGLAKRSLNKEVGEQVEVRFALLPQFWGLGYASELTEALIKFAFEKLKLSQIIASTGLTNEKSARVLEKNGFKYVKNIMPEGYAFSDMIKYYVLKNSKSF